MMSKRRGFTVAVILFLMLWLVNDTMIDAIKMTPAWYNKATLGAIWLMVIRLWYEIFGAVWDKTKRQ